MTRAEAEYFLKRTSLLQALSDEVLAGYRQSDASADHERLADFRTLAMNLMAALHRAISEPVLKMQRDPALVDLLFEPHPALPPAGSAAEGMNQLTEAVEALAADFLAAVTKDETGRVAILLERHRHELEKRVREVREFAERLDPVRPA